MPGALKIGLSAIATATPTNFLYSFKSFLPMKGDGGKSNAAAC